MQHTVSPITVTTFIQAPIEKVWACWTAPEHIMRWNNPSDDWFTSRVENDVRPGGSFLYVMETRDSKGFDFKGIYDEVLPMEKISYTLHDGRKSTILFAVVPEGVRISETFDPAPAPSPDLQRDFCAGVLNTFRQYTESVSV
ncbi:SRPBCC domain-containing protein [Chitinophaga solisilvae]|uniref:SRPBCC domain-containing protein n=1 Tax=Chitinophaga solisilvae TaxID=1233460 RepID=UPI00136F4D5E|nr:SRPBCC domain-containing protein [Chitinophaga solisilvae]